MQLTPEFAGDVCIVDVPFESLESFNAQDFKRQLLPLLQGATKLVLDMSKVQFIDSMGAGVLLSCLRQLTSSDGDMKLCAVTKPARNVLELIRMHRIIDICNDRDEALRAFSEQ